MDRLSTTLSACTLHRWVLGSSPDLYSKLELQDSLVPVKKFPTNFTVSGVDLSSLIHRNLQKFQGNPRFSGLCQNPHFSYCDSEGRKGGRKAWSSTQSSGMPNKDKLACPSTPQNKANSQANSSSSDLNLQKCKQRAAGNGSVQGRNQNKNANTKSAHRLKQCSWTEETNRPGIQAIATTLHGKWYEILSAILIEMREAEPNSPGRKTKTQQTGTHALIENTAKGGDYASRAALANSNTRRIQTLWHW